ncbi:MAG: hypothetical protein U9N82_07490 [Thermodesulfobacteriota bacterium]|nr:hypothetical protein [Thermodesulfobacteriota bacterium]
MKINFECTKCQKEFDCEMGKIRINETTMRPDFEKPIVCPRCGERTMDEVFLTELGMNPKKLGKLANYRLKEKHFGVGVILL